VRIETFEPHEFIRVEGEALRLLAEQVMRDINDLLIPTAVNSDLGVASTAFQASQPAARIAAELSQTQGPRQGAAPKFPDVASLSKTRRIQGVQGAKRRGMAGRPAAAGGIAARCPAGEVFLSQLTSRRKRAHREAAAINRVPQFAACAQARG
jgi:hypothetical protein